MKRKIIPLIIVLVLLASILSGCTLFVLNEERDYNQTLATVNHKGMDGIVTKGEFLDYYAQNAQIYQQYYQWSITKCVDEFIVSLAKKEIMLIEARSYFASLNSSLKIDDDIMKFLGFDEQKWVIEQSNKMFKDAFDAELKKINSEEKANSGNNDTEEEDKDALAPRPTQPKEEEENEFVSDGSITESDIPKSYIPQMEEDKKNLSDNEKKALKELNKSLSDQYKDYKYFEVQQAEARLLKKYQEIKQSGIEISNADLVSKYNFNFNADKLAYKTDSAYKTAFEKNDDTVILYHNGQYVRVKSVLIKFSKTQQSILTTLQETYKGDDYKSTLDKYRAALVFGDLDMPFAVDEKHLGLYVNVSNLKYDKDAICEDKDCICKDCENSEDYKKENVCEIDREQTKDGKFIVVDGCSCVACENNAYERFNVPYMEILDEMATAIAKAGNDADAEYNTKFGAPDMDASKIAGKKFFIAEAKLKEFDNWIFKINDDEGMFDGKEYTETPQYKDSSYVVEYTALVRALLETKNGMGTMTTNASSYTVITSSKETKDIPIYKNSEGNMAYIINDFGVHIVMISSLAIDESINTVSDADGENVQIIKEIKDNVNPNKPKDTFYSLKQNAFVSYDKKTGKALTVLENLNKTMEETAKNDVYGKYEFRFFAAFGDDFFSKNNKSVSKNKSVYNQLLKLTGADKEAKV